MKPRYLVNGGLATILSSVLVFSMSLAADVGLPEKAKEEGKVVAYLAMNAADAVTVQSSFEKKFPQIKVDLVRMGAPSLLQRILTESRGGKVLADVVLGFGFIHYELVQQKLLARYDSPERNNYVTQFKDKDGYWTNVMPIVHTIAYNTKSLPAAELPVRYTDLLQPRWQGRLGMNSNNLMFLAAMMTHFGKESGMGFLQKLSDQAPQVRGGGSLLMTLVAAGEFPLGFSINENNVENLKLKGAPVDWVRLADPLYGELVPIGIMSGAAHPNAARLFIDYVLSREGQELFKNLGKIPARSDVTPNINIERDKVRMIPPEEAARTTYYAKLFDDLFVKRVK
ncbi:MAG TPA: extracellular solute-binding protein [Candidatus Limnocylindrales bacterium]|nr:extracellular solute-binding protein [Candidatus Limnocylindrales bacterium]